MKKALYVLGVALALVSCKEEAPVDYALVSGTITNKAEDFKVLTRDQSFSQTLNIAADGTFADTLRVEPGSYMLYDGKNMAELYLEAGNNIVINADVVDFKNTLTFTGEGSGVNTYIMAKGKTETEMMGEGTSFYELEEADYKAKANAIKTTLEGILVATAGIPEVHQTKEKRNLNYSYLGKLGKYEQYHAHYAKKPDFKASEGFTSELDAISYDNEEDFKFSADYKQMVSSHYQKQAMELAKSESLEQDVAALKTYGTIPSETIKNELLFGSASMGITFTTDVEGYYAAFMAGSTNEDHKKTITESYNNLQKLAQGQPSPKFVNYENYAGGTTSLDDLKGKFVYIDVWATWCGPCKAEIPFLQEVEKKYHGKNIEFVSLSADKPADYDKWRQMIVDKELGGIQLLADKVFESQFIQDYMIKGIPRFILIDPYGNIVNANAPRPSNPALIDLFNELNI